MSEAEIDDLDDEEMDDDLDDPMTLLASIAERANNVPGGKKSEPAWRRIERLREQRELERALLADYEDRVATD